MPAPRKIDREQALAVRASGQGVRAIARALGVVQHLPPPPPPRGRDAGGARVSGLSKHLRLLADAGLVQTRREGYYVLYGLVPDSIATLADGLEDYLAPE